MVFIIKKLAIVTDSASYLSDEFRIKHNIHLLPLNVVFEKETFEEIIELSEEDFYSKLRNEHPKTAQPSLEKMINLYTDLKSKGYTDIYSVHCSSELSGSYNSSILAAKEANVRVHSIDSRIGSYPMAQLCKLIYDEFYSGSSHEEIMSKLNYSIKNSHLYFIPASLKQLKKSGRVSGSQAILSSILNIKLICGFYNGKVILFDKVRSEKKSFNYILDKLNHSISNYTIKEVAVIHCNLYEEIPAIIDNLRSSYPDITFTPTPLSAAVGVHAGEKTLGLSWIDSQ